jgi:fumarate hydratase class II
MSYRIEEDSMGTMKIYQDKYWGAQTQRSLENFKIGHNHFGPEIIWALGVLKKSAALANRELGELDPEIAEYIITAADEVIEGRWNKHFPLVVWQTGSGTQTNMNANEVIANRAIELKTGALSGDKSIHPNDHVNKSQSSNDVFSSCMHLATVKKTQEALLPALAVMIQTLEQQADQFQLIMKVARTHLMDAVPMTVGQEFGAWAAQIKRAKADIERALEDVYYLPLGGTAVGTGANAPQGYASLVIEKINREVSLEFKEIPNKFSAIAAHDALCALSGTFRTLATVLIKLANDVRLLASGPRCGLSELILPANEPGSSMMPGKVNPTQCEALIMVAIQVMGMDAAIAQANAFSQLQLNTCKPLIIFNLLESIQLLSDAMLSFHRHCLQGIEINREQLQHNSDRNLMVVTSLTKEIGYDKAASIAKLALQNKTTIDEELQRAGIH